MPPRLINDMKLTKYIALICEGASENAVMDILLDNEMLVFKRNDLIEEEVIRSRDGKKFEERYLRKGFDGKITILRILDSRNENFKISKAYADKVEVINVITAPEIEMLIIFNEGKYKEYKKSGKKPSVFCKENLKMPKVKHYDFVRGYFSNADIILKSIRMYQRVSKIKKANIRCLTC